LATAARFLGELSDENVSVGVDLASFVAGVIAVTAF
jgi:hypothetical protein